MKTRGRVAVGIQLTPEWATRLRIEAFDHGVPMGTLVEAALVAYLDPEPDLRPVRQRCEESLRAAARTAFGRAGG